MPVLYYDKNKEDEQKQREEQNPNQPQLGQTSQQVIGGQGGGDLGVGTSQEPGKGTSSGSFVNLQNYLKAAEGRDFGKQVAGQVSGELQKAEDVRAPVEQEYKGTVKAKTVEQDPGFVQSTLDNPLQANMESWNKYFNAGSNEVPTYQYEGSDVEKQQKKGQEYAKLAGSVDTRPTLLNELYQPQQSYTSGMRNLDASVMGLNPGSFGDIRQQAQTGATNEQAWRDMLAGLAPAAQKTNLQTQDATRGALDYALATAENKLGGAANDRRAQYETDTTAIQNALKTGSIAGLTPDQLYTLKSFGLTPGQKMWGVTDLSTLGNFSSLEPSNYKKEVMTSPEEYSKLQALHGLGGQTVPWSLAQGGGVDLNAPYTFNSQGLQTALSSGERAYNNAIAASKKSGDESFYRGVGGTVDERIKKWGELLAHPEAIPQSLLPQFQNAMNKALAEREQIRKSTNYYDTLD